jgi:hypothetical protein
MIGPFGLHMSPRPPTPGHDEFLFLCWGGDSSAYTSMCYSNIQLYLVTYFHGAVWRKLGSHISLHF